MVIDHLGIVVKSIEDGVRLWGDMFGYHRVTEVTINTRQKVKVVFLQKQNSIDIKLNEPTSDSSPISTLARRGGGLHHVCFRCDDLSNELARLNALGGRTLSPPEPGEAFEDENIAFVFVGQGLNMSS
jgi:methylmalonyl-CoA/ethylmalonyl-CoA epimerase